ARDPGARRLARTPRRGGLARRAVEGALLQLRRHENGRAVPDAGGCARSVAGAARGQREGARQGAGGRAGAARGARAGAREHARGGLERSQHPRRAVTPRARPSLGGAPRDDGARLVYTAPMSRPVRASLAGVAVALAALCACSPGASPAPTAAPASPAPRAAVTAASLPYETLDQVRFRLLEEQDTDCDQRITVRDQSSGRFLFRLQGQAHDFRGTHALAHLL